MLSARSPKYPGLYDEESGVHFLSSRAVEVTEEQAMALAQRRYVDGILIGRFDDEGRTVDEQPAKDWAKQFRRQASTDTADVADDAAETAEVTTDDATADVAPKTSRSK